MITSWILLLIIYFIPYTLMVGQLGSTFKDSEGGVSDWIKFTSTKRLALLGCADKDFIPNWLCKRTKSGMLLNGYILTGVLVGIIIVLPLFGLKEIDTLVVWMTNLNAIVSPMCFLWVFLAFMLLYRHWDRFKNAEYKFIKNPKIGFWVGAWGFAFTAFACILGMSP